MLNFAARNQSLWHLIQRNHSALHCTV